jgi:predicted porin
MGENPSNAGATAHDGDGAGALVGYKVGSLDVAVSTAKTQYAKTTTTGDIRSTYAGLKYNFGPVLLLAGYYVDKVESSTAVTGKGGIIGANWQIGASEIRAAYSQYKTDAGAKPETKKLALGYVYNLSKRTALYTTYARVRNSGGATTAVGGAITAANQSSSGFDLGVRHSF